ncbi:MAG TPA: hypothetical protein VFN92_07545 [Solirubrobacterales bacterium]|nr:hypothetical protein [Solirubrobacterales bacterium]
MREEGAFTGPFWADVLTVGFAGQLFGGLGGFVLAKYYNRVMQPSRKISEQGFALDCAYAVAGAAMGYVAIGHAVRAIFF